MVVVGEEVVILFHFILNLDFFSSQPVLCASYPRWLDPAKCLPLEKKNSNKDIIGMMKHLFHRDAFSCKDTYCYHILILIIE